MDSVLRLADYLTANVIAAFIVLYICYKTGSAVRRARLAPLAAYPGPKAAATFTCWQAFVKLYLGRSFYLELKGLHEKHGEVIRIGPDELHFSNPQAYHDIYNTSNRWDKEKSLYHSFGEDRSSFGFLDYRSAKERKDILNRSFSAKAVNEAELLVQQKVDRLCDVFKAYSFSGGLINASRAFRSFTIDVITHLCFGLAIDAIAAPDFASPIIVAMDESLKILPGFRYFPIFKRLVMSCPPKISKFMSPSTAGLVDLQDIIRSKINALASRPETLSLLPHDKTIFHVLMSPEAHKSGIVPDSGSLYEESQALMFGGGDTSGNTLMVTVFHLLKAPQAMHRLKEELRSAWLNLDGPVPTQRDLEKLPYLNAVLREGLRLNVGVVAGLLRVVPPPGALISGQQIPGGTIVSCSAPFVHFNEAIFPNPHAFDPTRWLDDPSLSNWLVAFSRGPRSCLGINLAWLELRLALANVVRRFDLALDATSPDRLTFVDAFLPRWTNAPIMIRALLVAD